MEQSSKPKQPAKKKQQAKEEEKNLCILCYEEANFIGIGKCNHKPICHVCSFKLRNLGGSKTCPICNVSRHLPPAPCRLPLAAGTTTAHIPGTSRWTLS